MRQIEWVEEPFVMIGKTKRYAGDKDTLEDEEAAEFIRVGWAKCVETGERGERSTKPTKIKVDNFIQTVS